MKLHCSPKQRAVLKVVGIFALLFALLYLLVFGRALRQKDDHLGIAFAVPQTLWGDGVAQVDAQTYVTTDGTAFRTYMESKGYVHIDQLGSAHFYDKQGTRYLVTGRMYSRFFMVFHVFPEDKN